MLNIFDVVKKGYRIVDDEGKKYTVSSKGKKSLSLIGFGGSKSSITFSNTVLVNNVLYHGWRIFLNKESRNAFDSYVSEIIDGSEGFDKKSLLKVFDI